MFATWLVTSNPVILCLISFMAGWQISPPPSPFFSPRIPISAVLPFLSRPAIGHSALIKSEGDGEEFLQNTQGK